MGRWRAGLVGLFLLAGGCATHVIPPMHVAEPATVYLCDYGVHSSLLLPSGEGKYVEYNYGDWAFAALNKTDPLHTVQALFDSQQAALGRRYLSVSGRQRQPVPPNRPHSIQAVVVDAARVRQVVQQLDERYRQNLATAILNDEPDYDFLFVKDPQHYGLMHNCNTLTGFELQQMGCRVVGRPVVSRFVVEPSTGPASALMPAAPAVATDPSRLPDPQPCLASPQSASASPSMLATQQQSAGESN